MLDHQNELSSSSSDEDILVYLAEKSKQKNENYLQLIVPNYSDPEFMEHFRVSRNVSNTIIERFNRSEYYFHQAGAFGKLSASDYVLIFLWFASHEAASYRDVADRFGITISTLRKVVERLTYFLSNMSPVIITWTTPAEQINIMEQFSENGFTGVIGVIDGSHVKIDKPTEDPDSYINRKGYYSIQFQVVCDETHRIRDVMIGFPGSVHDSRVFRASPLSQQLENRCGNNYLLGDSGYPGYPCLGRLLTPYENRENLTRRQRNYNLKLAKTRYVVEHCLGILKQRFRQLCHLKLRSEYDIADFIRACCVLHNLALGDGFPEPLELNDSDNVEADHDYPQPMDLGDERVGVEFRNYIASILPLNEQR